MLIPILLVLLGVVVGASGTLIGVGGGFLLMPILLWAYPNESPDILTSISLAVVFFNSLSGSIAYARMKRIEFKSGFAFAAAGLPGTILGALSTSYIPRRTFDLIIGLMLVAASIFLMVRSANKNSSNRTTGNEPWQISFTDALGEHHRFGYYPWRGIVLSFAVGYLSSILGIGGGIIHVPALVHMLNFPVHIATATSHFILVMMSFSGSMTHLFAGDIGPGVGRIIPLAIGVIGGAQIGAHLSKKIHGNWITRGLAIALIMVGIRTLWRFF
ncbi:MAG: sulfite exporter TauE/SafE family protein [Candidatus Zixiibacteriota bacterium]